MRISEVTQDGWLLEDNNSLGIISKKITGEYVMASGNTVLEFPTMRTLKEYLQQNGVDYPILPKEKEQVVHYIQGYPVNYPDPILVESKDIPLFKKREKKGINLCAGYYRINTDRGWRTLFCPKETTLKEYEWKGPFRNPPSYK